MSGREKLIAALNHQETGKIPFDLGATKATGISASLLYRMRKLHGRDEPVKIYDTYQMLGLVDEKDAKMFGIDVLGIWSDMTVFGYRNQEWIPWTTPDGTPALIGKGSAISQNGDHLYMHPQGDLNAKPSGCLPLKGGLYFDYITRKEEYDEDDLNALEDYKEQLDIMTIDDQTLEFYKQQADYYYNTTDCGIVLNAEYGNMGATTMLNGAYAKRTPGIRDFADFLTAHYWAPEYIKDVYDAWAKLCIRNLSLLKQAVGDRVQSVFLCGTDFGTQKAEIMSRDMFNEFYVPYFSRINSWVHDNTSWKTVYHSCGSLSNILGDMIGSGIDCLNPIQTSSDNMDPRTLKEKYSKNLVFWGGGVDGQTTMTNGTPDDVEKEMREHIDIFRKDGGFVFTVVHNLQATYSTENVQRVFDVLKEYR